MEQEIRKGIFLMEFDNVKLDFSDVLIVPNDDKKRNIDSISSRKDVNLNVKIFYGVDKKSFVCTPVIAANMDGVGTPAMGKVLGAHNMLTALKKSVTDAELDEIANPDDYFLTIGLTDEDVERVAKYGNKFSKVCIDTPNGYLFRLKHVIRLIRKKFKGFLMVGNVITAQTAMSLFSAGADCVKVGIGPGSVCTTRLKTGIGYPQLSLILEMQKLKKLIDENDYYGTKKYICADGGCTNPGDIAKAFVAGADFVMIGGMLAGHDEGGGEIVEKSFISTEIAIDPKGNASQKFDTKKYVKFYGMSSQKANDTHNGGLQDYRAAEGKEVEILYRGAVNETVKDILGGIRSTCTYLDAANITSMKHNGHFIRVNNQHNKIFND